ncbi:MAG: GvpL/GvpF family gas vesicle protein [Rhizomicrobium sp.]|jgi:hypothetical protein
MLYVYGIVDSHCFEIIPNEGHEANDIVPVLCGAFVAAVSVLSARTIEATPQNVWRHERVLERLMQDHTVLPLRFGTICPDADALREFLVHSTNELLNDLERVRGKVEIALRIVDDDRSVELPGGYLRDCVPTRQTAEAVPGKASNDDELVGRGAAYLRARLRHHHGEMAREDSGKRLGRMLRQHLDAVLKDVVCAMPADASAGYLVSCLVERDRVSAFADALDRFRGDHPRFDVSCTGPWPPYSFVAAAPLSGGL